MKVKTLKVVSCWHTFDRCDRDAETEPVLGDKLYLAWGRTEEPGGVWRIRRQPFAIDPQGRPAPARNSCGSRQRIRKPACEQSLPQSERGKPRWPRRGPRRSATAYTPGGCGRRHAPRRHRIATSWTWMEGSKAPGTARAWGGWGP